MSQLDIGNGQFIESGRVPSHLLSALNQATVALASAQSAIRNWAKPLMIMQAPVNFAGGMVHCNGFTQKGVQQSGYTYNLGEVGGAVAVDPRDSEAFVKLGFTVAPSGPTASRPASPRVGLCYQDTDVGSTMRWTGTSWVAVTLT
jgi:hypothetical protein